MGFIADSLNRIQPSSTIAISMKAAALKAEGRREPLEHRRVYRPWGYYQSIDAGARHQVNDTASGEGNNDANRFAGRPRGLGQRGFGCSQQGQGEQRAKSCVARADGEVWHACLKR